MATARESRDNENLSSETGLFWKCQSCCYKNKAEFTRCAICNKRPTEETEYLFESEWKDEEHLKTSRIDGENSLQRCFQKICSKDGTLSEDGAKIAAQLIQMGHDEVRAIRAAKTYSTLELALDVCKRQQENESRISELLADNILYTYEKAERAITLIDLGHPRMLAIQAAKATSTMEKASKFLKDHCQIGNRCFPIRNFQMVMDSLAAEHPEIPVPKLEMVAKLVLMGHPRPNAFKAATQCDTFERAKKWCLKEMDRQRRIDEMVSEEILPNEGKASIAIALIDSGCTKKDAVLAARRCATLEEAEGFLRQECKICLQPFQRCERITMNHCRHSCCKHCARSYFTISIREKALTQIRCPFCDQPDLENGETDRTSRYFAHLCGLLKGVIDEDVYAILEKKWREYVLETDSDFILCPVCKKMTRFCVDPPGRRLLCPHCDSSICALCRERWDDRHGEMFCMEFKTEGSEQDQNEELEIYLKEHGVVCPHCRFKYELSRGGCMHFTCSRCHFNFCVGCKRPFLVGEKCDVSENCKKLGLHAHHPRNCLYYWRNKEVDLLQKLLRDNNIEYNVSATVQSPENSSDKNTCPIVEQEEMVDGLRDRICGKNIEEGQADFCREHCNEYLMRMVQQHALDPVWVMDLTDLRLELDRHKKEIPARNKEEGELDYIRRLRKLIIQQIPLED